MKNDGKLKKKEEIAQTDTKEARLLDDEDLGLVSGGTSVEDGNFVDDFDSDCPKAIGGSKKHNWIETQSTPVYSVYQCTACGAEYLLRTHFRPWPYY